MKHAELIARLEAAEVGSRELDSLVARGFGWHRVEPRHARNKHGAWIAPHDFLGIHSDGSPVLDGLHGTEMQRDPPRITQSLDAARALHERVLPETGGVLSFGGQYSSVQMHVPGLPRGRAKTPELAWCIAMLRALDSQSNTA